MLDAEGKPVSGLEPRVGAIGARPCGRGCYRALVPSVGSRVDVHLGSAADVSFDVPARWPVSAVATLRKTERALAAALGALPRAARERTGNGHLDNLAEGRAQPDVVLHRRRILCRAHRCSSLGPGHQQRALAALACGSRLGARPALGTDVRNVVMLAPAAGPQGEDLRFALFEPSIPAWYDVTVERAHLPPALGAHDRAVALHARRLRRLRRRRRITPPTSR